MTTQNTLWLIDDDPALRLILEETFKNEGLNVIVFASAKGAWSRLNDVIHGYEDKSTLPDVILTDIRMPMMDGLSFSEWVNNHFPDLPIVIMTAHSDLKSAVESYQSGAFEYLPKPFDLDDAVAIINKAIRPKQSNNAENIKDEATPLNTDKKIKSDKPNKSTINEIDSTKVAKKPSTKAPVTAPVKSRAKTSAKNKKQNDASIKVPSIIGQSQAMQTVFKAIGRLSNSPITVLITGESGTGKELVASALHQHSPRQNKPFIALNMAAIPHDLIESELFGHEKGAFTGATAHRQGRFEQADGGTLFLDEIGDMPFSTQTRLLRVLANGEFFRVGGQKPIKVDVRIIAATHQNLEQLVKEGKFREDLFYRLNVIRLPLPPLRVRPDDIAELSEFFMAQAAKEMNTEIKQLSSESLQLMQHYSWPGNVRQLENACRWITVMATGDIVMVDDLPPEIIEFARINNSQQSNSTLNETNQTTQQPVLADSESSTQDGLVTTEIGNNIGTSNPTNFNNNESKNYSDESGYSGYVLPDIRNEPFKKNSALVAPPYPASESAVESVKSSSTTSLTEGTALNTPSWQHALTDTVIKGLRNGHSEVLQQTMPEFERLLVKIALDHTNGRKGEAAKLLGWGRNTLTRKIKNLELDD